MLVYRGGGDLGAPFTHGGSTDVFSGVGGFLIIAGHSLGLTLRTKCFCLDTVLFNTARDRGW